MEHLDLYNQKLANYSNSAPGKVSVGIDIAHFGMRSVFKRGRPWFVHTSRIYDRGAAIYIDLWSRLETVATQK
jgi:hypothetical protein